MDSAGFIGIDRIHRDSSKFIAIHQRRQGMNRDDSRMIRNESVYSRYENSKKCARICSFWARIGSKSCIVLNFKGTDRACVSLSNFFLILCSLVGLRLGHIRRTDSLHFIAPSGYIWGVTFCGINERVSIDKT